MRNGYGYWTQLPTRSPGERTTSGKLAEGVELGSNLLRVAGDAPTGIGPNTGRKPHPDERLGP
jgi:hypothetical protein